jgi:hypothetical protein
MSPAALEQPEPAIVEDPEPKPKSLDVLDDQVSAFGVAVGEPGGLARRIEASQRSLVRAKRVNSSTSASAQWV